MKRGKTWWIAGLAAGAVLVAAVIGTGAVMAQTPVPGTSTTGTTLIDGIAAKLGIDSGTVRDAVKSSETDEIDSKLQAGEITQAQADEMKARIASAPDGALGFGDGPGGHHGGPGFGNPDDLAQFLGTQVVEDVERTPFSHVVVSPNYCRASGLVGFHAAAHWRRCCARNGGFDTIKVRPCTHPDVPQ